MVSMRRIPEAEHMVDGLMSLESGSGVAQVDLILLEASRVLENLMSKSFPNCIPLLVIHKYF